eukprot:scaffold130992_cov31-Prasinocladus_malaysianus.AAC.1
MKRVDEACPPDVGHSFHSLPNLKVWPRIPRNATLLAMMRWVIRGRRNTTGRCSSHLSGGQSYIAVVAGLYYVAVVVIVDRGCASLTVLLSFLCITPTSSDDPIDARRRLRRKSLLFSKEGHRDISKEPLRQ